MNHKISFNMLIETEKVNGKTIFIASSPDINVFAEGETIEETKEKFVNGVKIHLENFPEEKKLLTIKKENEYEMPLLTKVFL